MRYPSTSYCRKFGSYRTDVGSDAMEKKGSPPPGFTVSVWLFCQTTVTWLFPGMRKNGGASGANGSRNLLSYTACATRALFSSERGTVFTSSCVMTKSPFLSVCETQPIARSIGRTFVVSMPICEPVAGMPGLKSPPTNALTTGVGAAFKYATTIVFASPGFNVSGPEDWKKRVSAAFWAAKQKCNVSCCPWNVQGKSPWLGSVVPER